MKQTLRSGPRFLCSCGASARAASTPPEHSARLVDMFRDTHLGEGHHEVDQAEFKRVLARQRRAERRGTDHGD